jgi:hypothetical protein
MRGSPERSLLARKPPDTFRPVTATKYACEAVSPEIEQGLVVQPLARVVSVFESVP